MSKFVFVVGAVYSGTGKGCSCGAIALLMKLRGFKVGYLKLDPYLSTASTLSPVEHGENFVCEDGKEADCDIGHMYRMADMEVSSDSICTAGQLYKEILTEDEEGLYLGQSLQVVPHLTNKIVKKIEDLAKNFDIFICEIGGCPGDIEANLFFESIRLMKNKYEKDCLVVMVAPIVYVPTLNEFKTKPLQRSVRDVQSYGFTVDVLLCRTTKQVSHKEISKISNLTGIKEDFIIEAPDVESIYMIPVEFYDKNVDDIISDKLRLKRSYCRISKYRELAEKCVDGNLPYINIGVVGKYDNPSESYLSIRESLVHAGAINSVKVNVTWINSENLEKFDDVSVFFNNLHGIIIAPGFGNRGIEGKIKACKYVRENNVPTLGICLGLQCMSIEFARNVCGYKEANSMEFNKNVIDNVIHYVEGQEKITKKSGTMRLGAYECEISDHSLAMNLFQEKTVNLIHRHRLEFNTKYSEEFKNKGFKITGINPSTNLVEIMEMDQKIHSFYICTQSHPEYSSKLQKPSPLFKGLISAAIERKKAEEIVKEE